MFAVKVNRFNVLRNGKEYRSGDIIYGLTEAEAHKLADESGGDIEIVTVIAPGGTDLNEAEAPADKPKEPSATEEETPADTKLKSTRGKGKKE